MKLKVEKQFVDKNTNELHKVGEVIEVNKARSVELLADTRELVSLYEEKNPKKSRK